MIGGSEALDAFRAAEMSSGGDTQKLSAALANLLVSGMLKANELIEVSRQSLRVDQFREGLNLDFAAFNASLVATGADINSHPEIHAAQLLNYITENEISIIDALRNAVAPILGRFEAAPHYAQLKSDIRKIAADPSWLPNYKSVPDDLIAEQVANWLQRRAPLRSVPTSTNWSWFWPFVQQILVQSRGCSASAAPLVRSWCAAHGVVTPDMWINLSTAKSRLRDALERAGVVDFRRFDDAALLEWCAVLRLWPEAMDRTLDREKLKIAVTDIEEETRKAREEADRVAAKARSVPFNGRDIDPVEANWTLISAEIEENLSKHIKGAPLGKLANLAPVVSRSPDQPNGSGRGGGRSGRRFWPIPQPKKDMVGQLSKLVVYHWLKERLPTQDIDNAWVSENGFRQLGKQGSDSEGFDFKVEYRKQTWQIEVKASLGDHRRFEMGETEVRAARDAAKPRSTIRYCIVYVADPHDPPNTRIDVLPNPMSEEADGMLDLLGEGVRFGFNRR